MKENAKVLNVTYERGEHEVAIHCRYLYCETITRGKQLIGLAFSTRFQTIYVNISQQSSGYAV